MDEETNKSDNSRFALNVTKTLADAGSFYPSSMKGKQLETATTFVASGLNTSLINNIDNVYNNLKNNEEHKYLCSNYDFSFTKNDIIETNTIRANLDIIISTIHVVLKNKEKNILVCGIDFYQEVDTNINSNTFNQYTTIKFIDTSIVGENFSNLESFRFSIQGTYTNYSKYRNSFMGAYIGSTYAPVGSVTKAIADYVGGGKQSIANYEYILNNAIFDSGAFNNREERNSIFITDSSSSWVSRDTSRKNLQVKTFRTTTPGYLQSGGFNKSSSVLSLVKCITLTQQDIVRQSYPFTYPTDIRDNFEKDLIQYQLGSPILYVMFYPLNDENPSMGEDLNLYSYEQRRKTINLAKTLCPMGYNLKFIIGDTFAI